MKNFGWVGVLAISLLAVVIIGTVNYKQKNEDLGVQAAENHKNLLKRENEEKQKLIDGLNPDKNKNLSILDYLKYIEITKNELRISVLGSSVTKGTGATSDKRNWLGVLNAKISSSFEELSLDSVNIINKNHGVGGYSIIGLLHDDIFKKVIDDKPNLIIFESTALTSQEQSVSIEETLKGIEKGYKQMSNSLPDTKIIIMAPNPSAARLTEKNDSSLTYEDYNKAIKKFSKENKWLYFDTYSVINKRLEDDKLNLYSILIDDGIHPNDMGYSIWGNELFEFISSTQIN